MHSVECCIFGIGRFATHTKIVVTASSVAVAVAVAVTVVVVVAGTGTGTDTGAAAATGAGSDGFSFVEVRRVYERIESIFEFNLHVKIFHENVVAFAFHC